MYFGTSSDSQNTIRPSKYIWAGGADQVIREFGTVGALAFASETAGSSSAAETMSLSNVGNDALEITRATITGTNAADYKIESNTTTCKLTGSSTLANGKSCKIGIIFTPPAAGFDESNTWLVVAIK